MNISTDNLKRRGSKITKKLDEQIELSVANANQILNYKIHRVAQHLFVSIINNHRTAKLPK